MKSNLIACFLFSSLLVASASSSAALGGTDRAAWAEEEGGGSRPTMAALGGAHEPRGAENSVEVEGLGRFAVDEHNSKEVILRMPLFAASAICREFLVLFVGGIVRFCFACGWVVGRRFAVRWVWGSCESF